MPVVRRRRETRKVRFVRPGEFPFFQAGAAAAWLRDVIKSPVATQRLKRKSLDQSGINNYALKFSSNLQIRK